MKKEYHIQTAKPFKLPYVSKKSNHISSTRKQIKAPKKPLGKNNQGGGKYWPLQYCLSSSSMTYLFRSKEIALTCPVQAPAENQSKPSSPAPTKG